MPQPAGVDRIFCQLSAVIAVDGALSHGVDLAQLAIGSGIDQVEVGIRLRYKIIRRCAPYTGIEQSWRVGDSADYARGRGEHPSVTNYVLGIRFWF